MDAEKKKLVIGIVVAVVVALALAIGALFALGVFGGGSDEAASEDKPAVTDDNQATTPTVEDDAPAPAAQAPAQIQEGTYYAPSAPAPQAPAAQPAPETQQQA